MTDRDKKKIKTIVICLDNIRVVLALLTQKIAELSNVETMEYSTRPEKWYGSPEDELNQAIRKILSEPPF